MVNFETIKKISLLIFLSTSVAASVTARDDYFNVICSADDSVGFNWKNSQWNFTKFYLHRYIVQKLKVERFEFGKDKTMPNSGTCWNEMQYDEAHNYGDKQYAYGCYNIRKEGTDYYSHNSEKCLEIWEKSGDSYEWHLLKQKSQKISKKT